MAAQLGLHAGVGPGDPQDPGGGQRKAGGRSVQGGDEDRVAGRHRVGDRRGRRHRGGAGRRPTDGGPGPAGEDQQRHRRQDRGGGGPKPARCYARKLQSFCPMKDSGVPAAIEIACATTFAIPVPSTREISTT